MNASILLVEDDLVEARRLESALAHLGYRTTLAEDGDTALARLQAERFDAVLLDLVLPGLDGMGLLSALRMQGIGVPVVVAVTPGGLDAARSALKAGARDFVVKPAGALRLEVALANAVAQGTMVGGTTVQPATAQAASAAAGAAEAAAALPRPAPAQNASQDTSPVEPSNIIRFAGRAEAAAAPAGLAHGDRAHGDPAHGNPMRADLTRADAMRADLTRSGLARLDARGHVRPLAALEAETIRFAFSHYGGRMSEVARRLGIGRSTLYRKMADLGLAGGEQTPARVVAAE